VDLGAGSGIFLERMLNRFPQCRAVWVDYSTGFQRVAQRRLGHLGHRVKFVCSRLEADWEDELPQPPDVICSMSTIHHLSTADKKRLYQRCFAALKSGGWLYNTDEMAAPTCDAYLNTLHYWVKYVQRKAPAVPAELQDACKVWCDKFEGWKQRNVVNAGQPKLPGDDIHDGYIQQLQWLRDSGFVDVDIFVKFQLWVGLGGRKPLSTAH
jgi:tRNA (cmo5U34)-methyltransferase